MSTGVIDHLELIQVDEDQDMTGIIAALHIVFAQTVERLAHMFLEGAAVIERSQRVALRQPAKAFDHLFFAAGVVHDQHRSTDFLMLVVDQ